MCPMKYFAYIFVAAPDGKRAAVRGIAGKYIFHPNIAFTSHRSKSVRAGVFQK